MVDYIVYFFAFFITVPFFATLVVYMISRKVHPGKWKAVHKAVNWTTILYIIADIMLISIIFDRQFTGIAAVILLFILTLIIIIQWKTNTEVLFGKAFKTLWRISFLLFLFIYICLLMIGIIQRIFFY
ncbi:hypothetical protein CIL03_04525 [Virgibacillus indicus]|uniref:DUF3397 domain-containing protein n=1 Tax=Virgibacillus indicus TaxID=2024554 RepID=A0A265NGN8_9BACI|nr:DUF3397 domain-containing protein [Virgibacillus indicus]OZU90416.1 hypothetical protein CIL03_04525 [Virgibacillus indicus]